MKGSQGLLIAVMLGLLGVALNYIYLREKTSPEDTVSFVGIKEGVEIMPGKLIQPEHLVEVKIPTVNVYDRTLGAGNSAVLRKFFVQYKGNVVAGTKATRRMSGNQLVLATDYSTAPKEFTPKEGEQVIWVKVNSRSFVSSLFNPGDRISFILAVETPASGSVAVSADEAQAEEIGPFIIASIGNRLSTPEVMKTSGVSPMQQGDIGIVVRPDGPDRIKLMNLLARMEKSKSSVLGITKHFLSKTK